MLIYKLLKIVIKSNKYNIYIYIYIYNFKKLAGFKILSNRREFTQLIPDSFSTPYLSPLHGASSAVSPAQCRRRFSPLQCRRRRRRDLSFVRAAAVSLDLLLSCCYWYSSNLYLFDQFLLSCLIFFFFLIPSLID